MHTCMVMGTPTHCCLVMRFCFFTADVTCPETLDDVFEPVSCLALGRTSHTIYKNPSVADMCYCLVLREIDIGIFERVGLVELTNSSLWFRGSTISSVFLI